MATRTGAEVVMELERLRRKQGSLQLRLGGLDGGQEYAGEGSRVREDDDSVGVNRGRDSLRRGDDDRRIG